MRTADFGNQLVKVTDSKCHDLVSETNHSTMVAFGRSLGPRCQGSCRLNSPDRGVPDMGGAARSQPQAG